MLIENDGLELTLEEPDTVNVFVKRGDDDPVRVSVSGALADVVRMLDAVYDDDADDEDDTEGLAESLSVVE